MPESYPERQIAFKLRIKEISEGDYIVEEGWKPNYLLTKKGEKVSRVNLMAVVLDKEENGPITNLILDDGSGKILVRSFEEIKNLKEVGIGESLLVIGRIRIYNNEKYLSPEIIKKIDKNWLKVRALELAKEVPPEEAPEALLREEAEETLPTPNQKILNLIRELDKGEGALIEEVKESSPLDYTEELLEKMLAAGEIFQNLPGRVKVL